MKVRERGGENDGKERACCKGDRMISGGIDRKQE